MAGRPSKYKPEYAEQMEEYFGVESGYDVEAENSKGVMQSVRHAADLPTFAAFATKLGVHRETLLNWAGTDDEGKPKHPEFFDAYKRAADHQERILVQNALKGGYQPSFAIFTAKNVLKWRDKTDHEITGKDGGPIETNATIDPSKLSSAALRELVNARTEADE